MGRPKVKPNYDLDKVCYLVNDHPSQLPIYFPKSRSQKGAHYRRKNKCPYSRDYLYSLYVDKKMKRKEICELLNIKPGKLDDWFSALDIKLPEQMFEGVNSDGRNLKGLTLGTKSKNDPMSVVYRKRKQKMGQTPGGCFMYGYRMVYNPAHPEANNGGYILEHRQVIERSIHRFLDKKEEVHHLNFDRSDNRLINLMMVKKNDHHKVHTFIEKCGAYALGILSEPPESFTFETPAYWDGTWYSSLTIKDLEKYSAATKKKRKI